MYQILCLALLGVLLLKQFVPTLRRKLSTRKKDGDIDWIDIIIIMIP